MPINLAREQAALQRMTVPELRAKYAELFNDETKTGNRPWLCKRILWRLQALEEGGLSERVREKALAMANFADLRMSPPKPKPATAPVPRVEARTVRIVGDDRLPTPGTVLTRTYKGAKVQVRVLEKGFEYEGETYKSLSALAKAITGTHTNGYLFFRLRTEDR